MESWRDEKRLPLSELNQAMATYSADGQVDDASGGEAGSQEVLDRPSRVVPGAVPGGDPDPDSEEGRRQRPTPDGHPGPN
jgi:hypothetical protein